MAPPSIPGFYWDEEKKRYFKIQATHKAPPGASWSKSSVKRKEQEAQAGDIKRQRQLQQAKHIKPSAVLEDSRLGGLLKRELGSLSGAEIKDGIVRSFARGLVSKGHVEYIDQAEFGMADFKPNSKCLYVNCCDDNSGMGVAYLDQGPNLVGLYLGRDEETDVLIDEPLRSFDRPLNMGGVSQREMVFCDDMSSISYHPTKHKILLTSRHSGHPALQAFSPALSDKGWNMPSWVLGESNSAVCIRLDNGRVRNIAANTCIPAPASSNSMLCVLGTSHGICHFPFDLSREQWLQPRVRNNPRQRHPDEVFSLCFKQDQDPNLLLSGGRRPHVWLNDLRVPSSLIPQMRICTTGPSAHVRSVREHGVVAAGPGNMMALYDMRFVTHRGTAASRRTSSVSKSSNAARGGGGGGGGGSSSSFHQPASPRVTESVTRPVLEVLGYQNAAHMCEIGFDVEPQLGHLVAAATDDGRVRLLSLDTGKCVPGGDLDQLGVGDSSSTTTRQDGWGSGSGNGNGNGNGNGVVKALQWATLPGDRTPSLCVALSNAVHKYSFGPRFDTEGAVLEE